MTCIPDTTNVFLYLSTTTEQEYDASFGTTRALLQRHNAKRRSYLREHLL